MKWRCSSIGKLMTASRTKSDVLSQTAKSYIESIADNDFYGLKGEMSPTPAMIKGTDMEHESINLVNSIFFTSHVKNTERLNNEWITGEADIVTDTSIIDIKTSWSLDTFPKIPEKAYDALYEWQVRSYMWLYNKQYAQVIFCMIDTPDYLLNQWAVLELHKVSHIDAEKRITVLNYERDLEMEEQIKQKIHYANEYYVTYINQLNNKKNGQ